MKTPLGSVLGSGAAGEGTGHWWSQRVTAIALVPLVLWLAYSVVTLASADYGDVVAWLSLPINAILFGLFLAVMFYHSYLGLQVVIEDYVHVGWAKLTALIALQFAHVLLGAVGIFALLRFALGGPG